MNLQDLFTVTTLTSAINKLPALPTKAGSLGIFNERGISTTTVTIEIRNGRFFLVPNVSRNDDPQPVANDKRNRRTFETAHLPIKGQVLPTEIQNLSPFGNGDEAPADPQAQVINDKLQGLKNSLEATREWQRIGALRGKILDADSSVLVDLYDEFGVSQKKNLCCVEYCHDRRARQNPFGQAPCRGKIGWRLSQWLQGVLRSGVVRQIYGPREGQGGVCELSGSE